MKAYTYLRLAMQTPETAKKKKRKKDEPALATPQATGADKSSKKKQKRQEESVLQEDKPTQPAAESVKTTAGAVIPVAPVPVVEPGKKKKKKTRAKRTRKPKKPADDTAKPEGEAANTEAKSESKAEAKKKEPQKRFIVFVGNLPFRTVQSELEAFLKSKELTPKSIRMPQDKNTNKPKGFAFVEFEDNIQLKQCLKLHHATYGDRRINVELTAGGGGKSEARVKKIQEKRERITQQRTGKPSTTQPDKQQEMF